MYSHAIKVDYDEVRYLVNDAAQNTFFRGLVSTRLGNDRVLDDELVDLVVTNQLLGEIFDELCCTESGRAKINNALDELFSRLRDGEEEQEEDERAEDREEYKPVESDVCRSVWMQAVSDPRFDIVLKEALDDSKLPPPVVRGSGLSSIMGLLDRIRASLTSGATKHSDAVLTASIIAALLAGGAGGHLIPQIVSSSNTPSSATAGDANINAIARDLHTIAEELRQQNLQTQQITNLESQVTQRNEAVTNLQQQVNSQYADLSTRIASASSSQIQQAQTSLTNLTNILAETNGILGVTNSSVKRLQDQVSVAEQVKESLRQIAYGIGQDNSLPSLRASFSVVKEPLQQIAYGIGPPQGKDDRLSSLRASSQQIADDLDPAPDTSKHDSPDKTPNGGAADKSAANSGPSSGASSASSTIAASLKALESDVRTSDKSFFREFSIDTTDSDATLRNADGQDCKVTWALISVSLQNAMIEIKSNKCQIDLPNNSQIVLDNSRKQLPGTGLELRFERPEQIRFWPLSPKGAIVAVYQNHVP